MQTTSHLLMIRPVQFAFNQQTAVNNAFQSVSETDAQQKALKEFDDFVIKLQAAGIDVTVVNDTPDPHTPDSIFPNNWVSFHQDGTVILYPMFAENRRLERKPGVLHTIEKKFTISKTIDLSSYEKENIFLEGTGSMVLDRESKIAYACLSPRTDKKVLQAFGEKAGYKTVAFTATDSNNQLIYHTNVMMCVADKYVVICLDSIKDLTERAAATQHIRDSGKDVIAITLDQMNHFAGNMLQVSNDKETSFLIMSSQAYESLTQQQLDTLRSYNTIIHSSLDSIEKNGGGSARCMMAEVFLPLK
jgi:hypothetical protein